MASLSLKSFAWHRVSNGFRVVQPKPSGPETIFANGGRAIRYFPFAHADNLHAIFARVQTSADLLRFIEKFGPLTQSGYDQLPRDAKDLLHQINSTPRVDLKGDYGERQLKIFDYIDHIDQVYVDLGEDVETDLKEADFFRRCLNNLGNPKNIQSILSERSHTFWLVPVPVSSAKHGLELQVRFNNLLEGLRFQLFQKLSGEAHIKSCAHCGQWFEVGPGLRRSDARFCSDRCRLLYNSAKRSNGK